MSMLRLVIGYRKPSRAQDPEVLFCGQSAGAAQTAIDGASDFAIVEIGEVILLRRAKRSIAQAPDPVKKSRGKKARKPAKAKAKAKAKAAPTAEKTPDQSETPPADGLKDAPTL